MAAAVKDSSGLTAQERHQIIIDTLKAQKKKTKVFHMRWNPGDNLDGKVLKSTPAFWYMRFGFSRQEIEQLFYNAKVYLDPVFESGLDAVFGTDGKGPRWLPPDMQDEKKAKWNKRGYYKTKPWWQVKELGNINGKQQGNRNYKDAPYSYDKQYEYKGNNNESDDAQYGSKGKGAMQKGKWSANQANQDPKSMNAQGRRRSLLNTELSTNAEQIWSKMSDYGNKNDKIDYKKFREALKAHNIVMDEPTAKKLFDTFADKDGYMDFKTLQEVLRKLDNNKVKIGMNIGPITLDDLDNQFNAIMLMKRVMLSASMEIPFNVTDFMNVGKIQGQTMPASMFLNKLATRDGDWQDRLNVMENIANNLGKNPQFDELLQPQNASDLLMGWSAQMLDERPQVSKTAIDQLPTVFHEVADKSHPDVAMAHLDDVVDSLFTVLDNKRHEGNHDAAKKALADIVDEVVNNNDAEDVLYLAGLLGEKTDIAKCTDPNARAAAMDNIKRIMMGDNNESMDPKNMPSKNDDPHKEWLDVGTKNKDGPSDKLMNQGRDDPNNKNNYFPNGISDQELIDGYNQKGKAKPNSMNSESKNNNNNKPNYGGNNESYGGNARSDRLNGDYIDDTQEDDQYGGNDVHDKTESEMGDDPKNPKRKKGKQNDIALKFGSNKPKDASNNDDNKNDANGPNDQSDQNGRRNPNSQNAGGPNGNDNGNGNKPNNGPSDSSYGNGDGKNDDDNKDDNNNGPNGNGKGNGNKNGNGNGNDDDEEELDDDGNPNSPGKKKGKRGGTKRKGANGKGDFDGKHNDNTDHGGAYGGSNIGSEAERIRRKKGGYNQNPDNKANRSNAGKGRNNNDPRRGGDDGKELDESPMSSNEIGDEFRDIVNDAVSNAILDPNRKNKDKGTKLADVLDQMAPNSFIENLDGDAKNRYLNWKKGPSKPYNKKLPSPSKPLPGLKVGTKKTHAIPQNMVVNIAPPTMPDI